MPGGNKSKLEFVTVNSGKENLPQLPLRMGRRTKMINSKAG